MTARQALDVLHRLNELQLMERRVEASERRQRVSQSTELCERQDGFLDYLGQRLEVGLKDRGSVTDYQAESERFETALRDRGQLAARLAQDEVALDQSIRECFGLERRNQTLRQVLATRQAESRRLEDQRRLHELDELWSQRRGRA